MLKAEIASREAAKVMLDHANRAYLGGIIKRNTYIEQISKASEGFPIRMGYCKASYARRALFDGNGCFSFLETLEGKSRSSCAQDDGSPSHAIPKADK